MSGNGTPQERLQRVFTIVRPDAIRALSEHETTPTTTVTTDDEVIVTSGGGGRVSLIPMSEWMQCLQRAIRTFMQAFLFLVGGGTVYQILTGLGVAPASAQNLPSTGSVFWDATLYSLVLGVVVFLWNAAEFFLKIDVKAPRWRA